MALLNIKTKSGFECEIDERAFKDLRLLKVLAKLDKGDDLEQINATLDVAEFLLGKRQYKKLENHVKDEDGFIDSLKFADEVGEILNGSSQSSDTVKK